MKQKLIVTILTVIACVTMAFTFSTDRTNEVSIAPSPIPASADNYTANSFLSSIIWKGYKVTGDHTGTIKLKSGALQFDGGKLVGGSFVIDMTTINCTDLDGGSAKKLEGHLKSEDFFGVKKYPIASFKITNVVSRGKPGDYKIVGNMTIKDKTKAIKFLAKIDQEDGEYIAKANIKIDRSDFNVKYGSGSFFDALGDKTIYDNFDLNLIIVTK